MHLSVRAGTRFGHILCKRWFFVLQNWCAEDQIKEVLNQSRDYTFTGPTSHFKKTCSMSCIKDSSTYLLFFYNVRVHSVVKSPGVHPFPKRSVKARANPPSMIENNKVTTVPSANICAGFVILHPLVNGRVLCY